jgi:hypothetical protein
MNIFNSIANLASSSQAFVNRHLFNRASSTDLNFLTCETTSKIASGSILAIACLSSAYGAKTLKSKLVFTTLSAIGAAFALHEIYNKFFTPKSVVTSTAPAQDQPHLS